MKTSHLCSIFLLGMLAFPIPAAQRPNLLLIMSDNMARCMEVYAAMIDCLNQGIGRIIAQSKKK